MKLGGMYFGFLRKLLWMKMRKSCPLLHISPSLNSDMMPEGEKRKGLQT